MVIFPIIIVISLIMYVYYKVSILRNSDSLYQVYQNAKARIALGIFMSFFGINQYIFYQTRIALYVAIAFIILGVIQTYGGYKRTVHYKNEFKKRKNA